jgi:DNA-binding XRE family transcriptional regulator
MPKNIAIHPTPDLKIPISPELIGKAIRAKRTQSQLRLEDAAALCGVAKQTLMKAEYGHPNTKISTLLKICFSLGIHISILPWQELNEEWY